MAVDDAADGADEDLRPVRLLDGARERHLQEARRLALVVVAVDERRELELLARVDAAGGHVEQVDAVLGENRREAHGVIGSPRLVGDHAVEPVGRRDTGLEIE